MKKDFTMEELQEMYKEASKNFHDIEAQLKQKKQEEEDRRKAELALEKEARKKAIEEAYETYNTLLNAYIKDYGSYYTTRTSPLTDLWKAFR